METDQLYDLLRQIGIEGLKIANGNIRALCPFHEERQPSWGIKTEEPHLHGCFSCGAKGSLYTLLTGIGRMPKSKARRLCRMSDGSMLLPDIVLPKPTPSFLDKTELYPFEWTPTIARYLASRGIPPNRVEKLGLLHNRKEKRLLFPWYFNQRLVGVTGRALDDNPARLLPYYRTQKGQWLYLPEGKISPGRFILVEGEIDAIKIWTWVYKNVGATGFGNFTDRQRDLLLNAGVREVIIATDDDSTGERLFAEMSAKLQKSVKVSRFDYAPFRKFYIKKPDPGEMRPQHLQQAFKKACGNSDWPEL